MSSKVSVIVPVYNAKQYLSQCVQSITEQTFTDLELLLIDDGSTDGCSEICDRMAEKDSRIVVIHKENGGAATARNLGIDLAKGEYILFIDADDWLDTEALEILLGRAEETDADIVRFSYVREFSGRQLVKKNTFLEERVFSGAECAVICRQTLGLTGKELEHPESMNYLASCCVNLYKKALIMKTGARFVPIQEVGAFVDGLFNFTVLKEVERFLFVDRPFYHYRKTNPGAATAGYRRNYLPRQLVLFSKLKNEIGEDSLQYYTDAFVSRILYSTMEISFNALRNPGPIMQKYREVRQVLNHEEFRKAYRLFSLKPLRLKWKIYFFFIKHSMTLPTYLMTTVILILKSRGTA